jgi:hypothetical protein
LGVGQSRSLQPLRKGRRQKLRRRPMRSPPTA